MSPVGLYSAGDEVPTEPPEVFRVPLPNECAIPNNPAHSYNQGQCSRRPCHTRAGPCSLLWRCCYEVGQTSPVPFSCSNSAGQLVGSVIVTCKCQPCEKLHAYIRGHVFSSRMRAPVVLAAVLLRTEMVAFTDENGNFFFELTTGEGEVTLLIQEVHHRPIEVQVNLRTSLRPEVAVTMEYIEDIKVVEKMQAGFLMELGDQATLEITGIRASIAVSQRTLLAPNSYDIIYTGSGHVLHSLYHMDSRPDFTSSAIQSMVYRDSKEVDFSIQSHISGSLRIVGETGQSLSFKQGSSARLNIAIRFEEVVTLAQVEGLHIFAYPDSSTHWLDNGKVIIDSVLHSRYSTLVKLHARLKEANVLWAVGFPSRITCYIKSKVSHFLTKQEQVGLSVQLEQSMIGLDRPSFYLASEKSASREGVCLKAVCNLGGLLYIKDTAVGEDVFRIAITPHISHGVIMGDNDQIMFYDIDTQLVTGDSSTPFYPTEAECLTSQDDPSGHFDFLVNTSVPRLVHKPSLITPVASEPDLHYVGEYCYIKVGVYDCSQNTHIQVLSYTGANHSNLVSMSSETLPPLSNSYEDNEACMEANVMPLRAACLQYTCGSDLHVSVTSWSTKGGDKSTKDHEQQSCRYWSAHPGLTSQMHLSDAMTSFHLVDVESDSSASGNGLYSRFNKELALLQCQAGDSTQHAKIMDHRNGIAVTFIC